MQKKLIALAVAGLASTAAFAQSNVTVYGIVDAGYVYVDADRFKGQHRVDGSVLSTSRLGFKGVEDLGNGLKALFTLEYGLTNDSSTTIGGTGTGGLAARQQFVGLTGGFGTAVIGRLQTTGLDFTVASSALGGSSAIGATNVVGGSLLVSAGSRANNAIAYISPSFGGLTVAVNHARDPLATETAHLDGAGTSQDYANLISADYANGPITAGAVYAKLYNESVVGVANVTEWGIRGGYDFGVAKLQAAYQEQDNGANRDNKKYVLSVSAPVTAKIGVIGEYAKAYLSNDGIANNDRTAFTLAGTYSLSKRTTAYAAFNALRVEGPNNDTNTYGVGVRHSF